MQEKMIHTITPVRWGIVAFLIGIFFSLLLAHKIQLLNTATMDTLANSEATKLAEQIVERLELYQYGLRGARGHILTKGELNTSRQSFHHYMLSRDIDNEFPGAHGFGFARRVTPGTEADYIARVRADGAPEFNIKQFSPHTGERFIIEYIEPFARNQQSLGLDISSETSRRVAAESAMRTGEVRLTAPITLVQAEGKSRQSFLILMPIYRTWATPATEAGRVQEAFGWSFAPLIMEEVLAKLTINQQHYFVSLSDITGDIPATRFHANHTLSDANTAGLFQQKITRTVYGRQWLLDFSITPRFLQAQRLTTPRTVFLWGLLFSTLVAMLTIALRVYVSNRQHIMGQQARLAAIVQHSADAIVTTATDGTVLSWNKGAEAIFGYSEKAALGEKLSRLVVPPELQDEEKQLIRRVTQGENIVNYETLRIDRSGAVIDVSLNYTPLHDEKRSITSFSKTLRDISAQKAAQAKILELNLNLEGQVNQRTLELKQLNQMLSNLLASATEVAIIATDLNGTITVFNSGAERMLGYSTGEMVGKQSLTLIHRSDEISARGDALSKEYGEAIDGFRVLVHRAEEDGADTQKWTYVHQDGHELQVSLAMSVLLSPEGELQGYLGIALDITTQLRIEYDLREAKQRADEASAAKSSFLANMSHEIRTPMNAVLGMLYLVQKTQLNPRQKDYILKAESSAKSLLGLLNDILDFSKMESGKLSFDPHPFEFEELMSDLSVLLAANHGDKDVEVLFQLEPNVPRQLIADRLRLQQILTNIASNALKFTEQGHVIVSVSCLDQTATHARLRFAVTDTGIGISEEQQTRIFNGFEQAESSTTRRFGGTGLGLVLSKRLVNLMGGELQLSSEPGKGSRFWFDIDLAIADATPYAELTRESLANIRVLVVDDNPLVADILQQTLSTLGFNTTHANSGLAAIEEVKRAHTNGAPFDVILMDWRMPEIDGLSAAQSISNNNQLVKQPVIIMVTAYEREVLSNQSEPPVPYQELLTKPVTPHQLAKSILQNVTGKTLLLPATEESEKQATPLQGLRLLVVEDNELNRQIAQELLEGAGATVELAEGGVEGINKVFAGDNVYDLVIMDIQMPDMDGYEATRRIRAQGQFSELPILAMTANASAADKENCLAAGMNGHLGKPIDIDELINQILRLLKREAISADAVSTSSDPLTPIDNAQTILKRFGNKRDLFARMLNNFRPEIMRLLDSLAVNCENNALTEATAALHSIKGVASTMGAKLLAQTAATLETQCKHAQDQAVGDVVSQAAQEKLLQLLELSETLLMRIAQDTTTLQPLTTGSPTLSRTEIKQHLQDMLPLLETDNMGAIDLIETLCEQVSQHRQLTQISALINALDYAQAILLIKQMLQENNSEDQP